MTVAARRQYFETHTCKRASKQKSHGRQELSRKFLLQRGSTLQKVVFRKQKKSVGEFVQLVLPKNCREQVLKLAHEVPMS